MLENNNKEQLIGSILDELKELEMLTQGMQDPRMLKELAVKKAQHLLASYELLKEEVATPTTVATPQKVDSDDKPFEEVKAVDASKDSTPVEKPVEAKPEKAKPVEQAEEKPQATQPTVEERPEEKGTATEKAREQEASAEKTESEVAPQNESKQQQAVKEGGNQTNNDRFKSAASASAPTIGNTQVKRVDSLFVKSLKSALKLNDRIRYSRELFGGSTELLNSTIEVLDQKKNLGEALAYINAQFNWDKDNEAVTEFLSLLERRF